MSQDQTDNQPTHEPQVTPWNGITFSLLVAAVVFCWLGYRMGTTHGRLGEMLGVILGIVAAIFATPLVFAALTAFIHLAIKVEDYFKRES